LIWINLLLSAQVGKTIEGIQSQILKMQQAN